MIVEPRRQIAARVVSSIEQALAKRHALMAAGQAGAVDELLHAMHTVKSARFNAAERLERKNTLSLFAMSMLSLYFVGLSVWQVIYAPLIADAGNRLITLVSIMSSVFTLVLALIEAMNDYRIKSHHMHACALAVNELYQELKLMRSGDAVLVQEFRRRYNAIIRGCPFNHARVDYLMARAERAASLGDKTWARLRYTWDVYALYGLCLLTPPLVLLVCR